MKTLRRVLLGSVGAIVLLGAALMLWFNGMARDDGGTNRPKYGAYTWPAPEPSASAAALGKDQDDPRSPQATWPISPGCPNSPIFC